jgi:hypothetical protein
MTGVAVQRVARAVAQEFVRGAFAIVGVEKQRRYERARLACRSQVVGKQTKAL